MVCPVVFANVYGAGRQRLIGTFQVGAIYSQRLMHVEYKQCRLKNRANNFYSQTIGCLHNRVV